MSVRFDDTSWEIFRLGEKSVLLTAIGEISRKNVRRLSGALLKDKPHQFEDLITGYDSIVIRFTAGINNEDRIKEHLLRLDPAKVHIPEPVKYEIPVCYEKGLDWEAVVKISGISKEEFIAMHSGPEYEVAMLGFLPGFIYLDGLPEELACKRRVKPRSQVPEGSVGIGGAHTGMYSLSSPGGWQIIGLSPSKLFNIDEEPPVRLQAGDRIRFKPITEEEFEKMKP
ncbi:5-oxoprolinase subunit PxpB [Balneola sp. MJW-20]|uniref:5-oxoprolinase subunit PxpB n=1 Tax=Gracilimonas aurantiaca TaxID=3234185 RepID=UPI003467DCA6